MSEDNPPEGAIQPPARYAVHKYMGTLYHLDQPPFGGNPQHYAKEGYWFFDNYWLAWGCSQRLSKAGYITFTMMEPLGRWPVTGATVCAVCSIDSSPFTPCANSVFEISEGLYGISLNHEMTQGNMIALHFTAPNTMPVDIIIRGHL